MHLSGVCDQVLELHTQYFKHQIFFFLSEASASAYSYELTAPRLSSHDERQPCVASLIMTNKEIRSSVSYFCIGACSTAILDVVSLTKLFPPIILYD